MEKEQKHTIAAIHYYKYTRKYQVFYNSLEGKYFVSRSHLDGQEKRFLAHGIVFDCSSMTIFA